MTKEEAIKIITQVCDKFVGTKQDHITIELALKVLTAPNVKAENEG